MPRYLVKVNFERCAPVEMECDASDHVKARIMGLHMGLNGVLPSLVEARKLPMKTKPTSHLSGQLLLPL